MSNIKMFFIELLKIIVSAIAGLLSIPIAIIIALIAAISALICFLYGIVAAVITATNDFIHDEFYNKDINIYEDDE